MVDGIGPIPGSMSGSLGLEITDSKNFQLNWKTITKGKRSRKSVTRSSNGCSKLPSESPVRVVDFSGSDSEKCVETSVWPHLSYGSVCVPLKKRRHMLWSPSSPSQASLQNADQSSPQHQTPSSLSEDLEPLLDNKNVSSGDQCLDSYPDVQRSARLGNFKIQMQRDKLSGPAGIELDESDDLSGIALLAAAACINNTGDPDNVKGGVMEASSTLGKCHTSSSTIPSGDCVLCSVPECCYQKVISQPEYKKCQLYLESSSADQIGDKKNQGVTTRSVSSKYEMHPDLCTLMEACKEDEASFNCIQKQEVRRKEVCATKLDCKNNVNDVNRMALGPTDVTTASFELKVGSHDDSRSSMGSTESKNDVHQIALLEVALLDRSDRKNDIQINEDEDSPKTYALPEKGTTFGEGMFRETCITLAVENSGTTSENPSHRFAKSQDICSSDVSARDQAVILGDGKNETEEVFPADFPQVNNASVPGSKDPILQHDKDLVSNEIRTVSSLQDSVKTLIGDDSHSLHASENEDHARLNGIQDICKPQMDYDSPYEDGELRGSVLYSCEGDEFEDGDHESVDYESDGRIGDDLVSADYPDSEGSQATGKKYSLAEQISEASFENRGLGLNKELEDNMENIEIEGKKVPNLGSGITDEFSSPLVMGNCDGNGRRVCHDNIDVSDVEGLYVEEIGAKVGSGKLQSFREGRTSDIREAVYSPHSRSGKVDRCVASYKSSLYKYRQTEGDRRLNYWDSRLGNQSGCRGQPRSLSARADSIGRSYENNQPEGIGRQFGRRRSPVNGVDFCGGGRKVANIQSNRRGSSENFSGGYFSSLREEYDEPAVDDAELPACMRLCLSRREWISPPSHGTPRFRARSPTWQSLQDRNLVPKRKNGSLEFRSESCMQRVRGPFQKPKFTADYGENFASPRGQFSQTRSSRWVHERNFPTHPKRHRKSPEDMFRRAQMLDTRTLAGRLESVDYFRPVRRSQRFPIPAGVSNRDELEEYCSNHRHDKRSRMIYNVRCSETSTVSRRSPLERRDNFEDCNCNTEKENYLRGLADYAGDYGESFLSTPRGQLSPSHSSRWPSERNFVTSPLRCRRSPVGAFSGQKGRIL